MEVFYVAAEKFSQMREGICPFQPFPHPEVWNIDVSWSSQTPRTMMMIPWGQQKGEEDKAHAPNALQRCQDSSLSM